MIEQFYYEMRPFIYLFLSLSGYIVSGTSMAKGCAYVLAACALLILYWRYETRQDQVPTRRRH